MRETLLGVILWGKGGSSEQHVMVVNPPSLPPRLRWPQVQCGWHWGREEMHCVEEGSACYGMGYQRRRTRWPEMKAPCCRSESRQFRFSEISRSTALSATRQQALIHISQPGASPSFPLQTTKGCCLGPSSGTREGESNEH